MNARRRSCRAIAPLRGGRRPPNPSAKPPLSPVTQLPKFGDYAYGLGERCAPPAASRCSRAARVRAPSRGDPPHDGRFAPRVPPALAKRACRRVFSATRVHADFSAAATLTAITVFTGADSTYAGGAQRSPEPDSLYYTNIISRLTKSLRTRPKTWESREISLVAFRATASARDRADA